MNIRRKKVTTTSYYDVAHTQIDTIDGDPHHLMMEFQTESGELIKLRIHTGLAFTYAGRVFKLVDMPLPHSQDEDGEHIAKFYGMGFR